MYTNETKKFLDNVRSEAGEPLFRIAMTHVIDVGAKHLTQEAIEEACEEIMKSKENPRTIMTNEYKCEILRVAGQIAEVPPSDLPLYINREMEFATTDYHLDYSRLYQIVRDSLMYLYEISDSKEDFMRAIDREFGIYDEDEIEALGFGWVLEEE